MKRFLTALMIVTALSASHQVRAAPISLLDWFGTPLVVGDKTFTLTSGSLTATGSGTYWNLGQIGVDIAVNGNDYVLTIEPVNGSSFFLASSTVSSIRYDLAYQVSTNDPNFYISSVTGTTPDWSYIGAGGGMLFASPYDFSYTVGVFSIAHIQPTLELRTFGPAIVSMTPFSATFHQTQVSPTPPDNQLPEPGSLALLAFVLAGVGLTHRKRPCATHYLRANYWR